MAAVTPPPVAAEPRIPVFTVLKNGAILKNIFIVNKPPPPDSPDEEILIVGRHPDCHIVLTHPSVSRFHLQILSNPSSLQLFLTDLSSVHGTWISDKRIEPGVRVELRQGDTLRVGASSRLYRLHWIPLSHAYDNESLRVLNCLPVDEAEPDCSDGSFEENRAPVPEGGVDSSAKDDCEEKQMYETSDMDQVVNILPVETAEIESTEAVSEVVELLVCDGNLGSIGRKETPSAASMPEEDEESEHGGENSSKVVGQENELSSFWAYGTDLVNLSFPLVDSTFSTKEDQYLQLNCVSGDSELDNISESSVSDEKEGEVSTVVQVFDEIKGQSDISGLPAGLFLKENSSLLIGEVLAETKHQQVEEILTQETKSDLLVNLDGNSSIMKDQGQTDQLCLSSAPLEYSDDNEEGTYPAAQIPGRTYGESSLSKHHGQNDNDLCLSAGPFVMEKSSSLVGEVLGEINNQSDEEESTAHQLTLLANLDTEVGNEIRCLVEERCGESEKRSVPPKNDPETREIKTMSSVSLCIDSADSFSPDGVLSEVIDDKENQTPQSICATRGQPESGSCKSPPLTCEEESIFGGSIWARRGKPASAVRIQTERGRESTTMEVAIDNELEVEIFTPDKENLTPNTLLLRSLKKKNEVEMKLNDTQEEEDELFTPDKENFTPNTLRLRSLKKKGELELSNSKCHRSSMSKKNLISNIPIEDMPLSPGKENQKVKYLQERESAEATSRNDERLEKKLILTKLRTERMPFQSLNSAGKNSRSEASVSDVATISSTSLACRRTKETVKNSLSNKFAGEGKRGWTMVADTNTLLDKKSRKALQFLQGLKGTHLIIPRMVIRELDCLKQHGSLFRNKTEACLVLEWIEECMVKTNWWIHVQSSVEDVRLTAPTPPASPQSSENSWEPTSGTTSSFPFLRCWSSMELVSPAAADHILDCALLHKGRSNEGHLVLLSNDITVKIKAMAEGLICETAQEFHESLVTPSSERFMWAGSCPRGRTWSYLADVVSAEKYNRCQLKKPSKGEGAKGLKLILLHNSHYGQLH